MKKAKMIGFVVVFALAICTFNVKTFSAELNVSANKAIVMEKSTGEVVYEKNAHIKSGIASTTKIMTAICAIENKSLDSEVKVSQKAVLNEGSSMYLKAGEIITLENLLYGLMLQSGNDAASVIAECVSGTEEEFVALMNKKAEELGLKNTSFCNPHGLDAPEHYSTAYDLACLTRYALSNETFAKIVSTNKKTVERETIGSQLLVNHNKLLRMYEGANGVKTGFTKSVGRCLVSSAERDGVEIIVVTLNAPDDWNDHMRMFDYGFSQFEVKKVICKGEKIGEIEVTDGELASVEVKTDNSVFATVKKDSQNKITTKMAPFDMVAPINKGDVCGELNVYNGDILVGKCSLVSETDVLATKKSVFVKKFKEIIKNWLMLF